MVRASVLGDRTLDEFSGIPDCYEQQKARNELADALEDAERLRLRECDACCHLDLYLPVRICSFELGFNDLKVFVPISKNRPSAAEAAFVFSLRSG